MSPSFSAVLLAGGKSTRMGRDKALLEINGQTLWRRQFSILEELEAREIFIAGPPRDEWRTHILITDAQSGAGPLGGLVSALRRSSTSHLLVLAIDLPKMTASYLRALMDSSSQDIGVVPGADRFEPLAAIYPKTSLPIAEESLQSGDYSLQKFAARCVAKGLVRPLNIEPRDEPLFANVNTPNDLLALSRDE